MLITVIKSSQKSHRLSSAMIKCVLNQVVQNELHRALISNNLRRQLIVTLVGHHFYN